MQGFGDIADHFAENQTQARGRVDIAADAKQVERQMAGAVAAEVDDTAVALVQDQRLKGVNTAGGLDAPTERQGRVGDRLDQSERGLNRFGQDRHTGGRLGYEGINRRGILRDLGLGLGRVVINRCCGARAGTGCQNRQHGACPAQGLSSVHVRLPSEADARLSAISAASQISHFDMAIQYMKSGRRHMEKRTPHTAGHEE